MSSSSTRGVLPPYPPTGVPLPAHYSIKDIIVEIEIEIGSIEYQPGYFLNEENINKLLYLNDLVIYWRDIYLVLYGERLQ